jgi:gentisate 1,2-dioxygenase
VLESSGGYTAVEGERCEMRRGDFITTPSWCWHDHKNTGDGPMIWLDGLDVPLVNFFGAKFSEECPTPEQPIFRNTDDSVSRWGSGLRPFNGSHIHPYSPVFSYPYAQARPALDAISTNDKADPHRGWKMIYTNPRDGGHVLPTIAAYLQKLPAEFTTKPSQTTEAQVFTVLEGRGTAKIGDVELAFEQNDTFVAPNWVPMQIETTAETVLFSFSDRAAQENLGIWRHQDL